MKIYAYIHRGMRAPEHYHMSHHTEFTLCLQRQCDCWLYQFWATPTQVCI